jgi:hypothetical protein
MLQTEVNFLQDGCDDRFSGLIALQRFIHSRISTAFPVMTFSDGRSEFLSRPG